MFTKTEDSRPRAMVRRLGFEWHARGVSAVVVGGAGGGIWLVDGGSLVPCRVKGSLGEKVGRGGGDDEI